MCYVCPVRRCMHACMQYIHTYVHTYIHMCMYTYICTNKVHIHICIYIYIYITSVYPSIYPYCNAHLNTTSYRDFDQDLAYALGLSHLVSWRVHLRSCYRRSSLGPRPSKARLPNKADEGLLGPIRVYQRLLQGSFSYCWEPTPPTLPS